MTTHYTQHGASTSINYSVQPYNNKAVFKFMNTASIAKANNNLWLSKFRGEIVEIEFSEFRDITYSFCWCLNEPGIYAVYMIPNDKKGELTTLPVVNEYMIYFGETDTSLATRVYKFRHALSALIRNEYEGGSGTVNHSGAEKFFSVMKEKMYSDCDGKFDSMNGYTLMVRVAGKNNHYNFEHRVWSKPKWKFTTKAHEQTMLDEVRSTYPGILYNTN